MEGTPNKKENIREQKNMEDIVFDTIVKNEIISAFVEDLENNDFSKEEIDEFQLELSNLSEEEIKGVLATPKELRERNFPRYKKQLEENSATIHEIIIKLAKDATDHGYTIGYHVSPIDIPEEKGEWKIKGSEFDDRDEMLMAYYSLNYKSLYRVDRGNKLYVVRAWIGRDTNHKLDTSNNWGRAATLSIIHKMDLPTLDQKTSEIVKELSKNELEDAA